MLWPAAWGFVQDVRSPALPTPWELDSQEATWEESLESYSVHALVGSELLCHPLYGRDIGLGTAGPLPDVGPPWVMGWLWFSF